MTDMITALLILSSLVAYWVVCRKTALKFQEMAVVAIEEYFDDESVPNKDKFDLYQDYKMCRSWYFLPLVSVMTPFSLAATIAKKQDVRPATFSHKNPELYDRAFNSMFKMMIIKNPLISMLSLAFIGLCFAVAMPISIALNRMSLITEASGFMGFFEKISSQAKRKAHTH